jgi:hypothetical protein
MPRADAKPLDPDADIVYSSTRSYPHAYDRDQSSCSFMQFIKSHSISMLQTTDATKHSNLNA